MVLQLKLNKKASKLEILEFIYEKEIVSPADLVERFGYTRLGAGSMLSWLKSQRLVINERRGEWTITDEGMRRLIYFGRL